MAYTNTFRTNMPRQKLSLSKKTKKWREQCVEAIAGFGETNRSNGRTSRERKQINYNLINSQFDERDFEFVLNPFNLQGSLRNQPARMRDINIIVSKINLLKGEEMKRPFDFQVVAINGNAVSVKEKKKKDMLLSVAQTMLAKEAGVEQQEPEKDPSTGKPLEPRTFEEVEKYANTSLQDIREQWGNNILQHLLEEEKITRKFNDGWEHVLVAAEEFYYVGIVNGEVKLRTVNPLNSDFDKNPDDPLVENGDWFREARSMTVGQILDEFGEFLTETQVQQLDEGIASYGMSLNHHLIPEFAYDEETINHGNHAHTSDHSNTTHYVVTTVTWRSMKKIGFLKYPDPTEKGKFQETIVDETYKLTPELEEQGYELEWTWINDVWRGTQIGDDFYVDINPIANQMRSMSNPYEVKLPYIGRVYNATNTQSVSLVDLLKPHQYLYNIIWFRIENEIAKAKGKKFVFDLAQLPTTHGMNLDKWMYLFDTTGIAFINSMEEGTGSQQNKTANFNNFTSIDLTMSQTVSQYLGVLDKIEKLVSDISGVSEQREGTIHQSETAQGIERSVTQSSHITEPYFYYHDEVKKQVLAHMLEAAKFAYKGNKKLNYILNDVERIMVNIDMDRFSDSEYNLFATNASKYQLTLAKMDQLAQAALQNDKIKYSDIVAIYNANSISEIANTVKRSEMEREQLESEIRKEQSEIASRQIQAQKDEKEEDRQHERNENQLDRQAELDKSTIEALGHAEDKDVNENLIPDVIEQGKVALERSKASADALDKLEGKRIEREKLEIEKEKIKSKERIEKMKARTALKNKVVGEK